VLEFPLVLVEQQHLCASKCSSSGGGLFTARTRCARSAYASRKLGVPIQAAVTLTLRIRRAHGNVANRCTLSISDFKDLLDTEGSELVEGTIVNDVPCLHWLLVDPVIEHGPQKVLNGDVAWVISGLGVN
jgi:hypothetical protein